MKLYQRISVMFADASLKTILESFAAHEVIEELCAVAESTFSTKISPKLISNAAAKCQIGREAMSQLIDCLALLLETAARLSCEPKEVDECLLLCGASAEVSAAVAGYIGGGALARLRERLDKLEAATVTVSSAPSFHSLRWRFDVEVASRCLGEQVVPLVKIQLVTRAADGALASRWLQTDPNNLRHLVESLEAALTAGQTNHAQRIIRYVK